jgi:hypothetical protein
VNNRGESEELRQALGLLALAVGPIARVQRASRAAGGDAALVRIEKGPGKSARLRLVPWGVAPPKSSREASVWVLRRAASSLRKQLRERDENFVDLAGAVRLRLPWLLIDRTDLEPVRLQTKTETRNPFSDRGSLVLRTVFAAGPEKVWSVRDLADASGVSLGLVSYVSSALAQRGLVRVQAVGRTKQMQITDPVAVIEQWTREYYWKKNTAVAFHASVGSAERFLRRLPEMLKEHRWALTLQAGASLVAPHATWGLIHVYIDAANTDELIAIGERQRWEAAEGGKVVLMAPFYKKSAWHGVQRIKSVPVVSNLQLILDLWHYPIRGREQAEHLIATVLTAKRRHG